MKNLQLQIGQQAPSFTSLDIYGNKISLENYKNKKLLLCFFRYAGCPFCGITVLKFIKAYPSFAERNLHIIAFFQSTIENIKRYIEKYNPSFPLIADQKKEIYNLYKVPSTLLGWPRSLAYTPKVLHSITHGGIPQGRIDGDLNLIPASFLIGPPELTIYQAYYGTTFLDAFSMEDINEFLSNINTAI